MDFRTSYDCASCGALRNTEHASDCKHAALCAEIDYAVAAERTAARQAFEASCFSRWLTVEDVRALEATTPTALQRLPWWACADRDDG